jgi:hypothetical protein
MSKLDRNRPHAAVYYDDLGRAFEQDGQFFTASGALWEPDSAEVAEPAAAVKPAKAAPKAKPAAAPEDVQLAAQMAGA